MAKHTRVAPELQNLDIWHEHEPQLRELYLVKNLTLKGVKESMEKEHGWPTFKLITYEVVLRDELGFVKNLTKDDWYAIKHHVEKRSRNSRQSQVVLHGHVVEQKRISKAIGRYRQHANINRVRSPVLRNGLRVRTPPLPSPRTLNPDDLAYIHMTVTARSSSRIMDAASPPLAEGQSSMLPIFKGETLTIEAIMDIRTAAPFNQLASILKDIFSPDFSINQETAFTTSGFPQMVTGTIATQGLQKMDRVNNQDQVADILGESSQNLIGESSIFAGINNPFVVLMEGCYAFSNNIIDDEVSGRFLDWIGLVAEMSLLKEFFRLNLPTVIAIWGKALDSSFYAIHGEAFEILIEIGLEIDNGRLMQSKYTRYLAMAIDMGSHKAMGSVLRLLKAGVSPNTRFDRTLFLPVYRGQLGHYWRCCALKQAAKNRDVQMLEHLLTVGNCKCGKFDAMWGNLLLSRVALSDWFTKRPPSLQCVEAILNSGIKVDFLPEYSDSLVFTVKSLGWHTCGKPELLVDRWAQECVTVSGVFIVAEAGLAELRGYLDSIPRPESTMKTVLLQVALTEAAYCGAITVLKCLLQFGVDPNVETLTANLQGGEEEEESWSPVARAAAQWHTDILATLMDYGADFKKYPLFKHVVRSYADAPVSDYAMLEARRGDTIQILLDAGVRIDVPPALLTSAALLPLKPSTLLFRTADEVDELMDNISSFEPNYALCNKLKQHGMDFSRGLDGCNTLQTVIRNGCNFATVSYLIHDGVQVHSIPQKKRFKYRNDYEGTDDTDDTTMLHDALINAHVNRSRIVDILLENGADIYANTSKGMSVLEASLYSATCDESYNMMRSPNIQKESIDIFWKLFHLMGPRHAYSLDYKRNSLTGYLMSWEETDDTICAALDAFGAPNSYKVVKGRSILMEAVSNSRTSLVTLLVERGSDINLRIDTLPVHQQGRMPRFNTALQIACMNHMANSEGVSIAKFLLEKGAEVNVPPTKTGMTALQSAAFSGNLGLVSTILEHGAEVNAKAGTQYGSFLSKRHPLSHGGKYHSLDFAAWQGHLDIVHLIVGAGGLSGIPGVTGLDGAMVLARKSSHTGIVDYLQRHTGRQLTQEMCQAFEMALSSARSDGTTYTSEACANLKKQ
ncbi:ankyrin repeat-containing domain protein [Apiospora kogelbergensis]|uniref:ankyrin repeat-containing domain protein n=1 Tax=Apiospora kogelbergensis TaxID=1337665 RepID=UPI00312E2AF1